MSYANLCVKQTGDPEQVDRKLKKIQKIKIIPKLCIGLLYELGLAA